MLTRASLPAWIVRAVKTKDVAVLKDDVDDATNSTFSEADIVIEGTKCKCCCDQVDLKKKLSISSNVEDTFMVYAIKIKIVLSNSSFKGSMAIFEAFGCLRL